MRPDNVAKCRRGYASEASDVYKSQVGKRLHGRRIRSVTRAAAASPSAGSAKVHAVEQAKLIEKALTL